MSVKPGYIQRVRSRVADLQRKLDKEKQLLSYLLEEASRSEVTTPTSLDIARARRFAILEFIINSKLPVKTTMIRRHIVSKGLKCEKRELDYALLLLIESKKVERYKYGMFQAYTGKPTPWTRQKNGGKPPFAQLSPQSEPKVRRKSLDGAPEGD